jgi:hypothetical protein
LLISTGLKWFAKGRLPMKRNLLSMIGLLTYLSGGFAAPKPTVYTGEITDSQCAQLGSHDKMMESNHTKNAEDCTFACVKRGATFVLFDPTTKTVYHLDNQKKSKDFAGLRVLVTGTLDNATMTIQVKRIDTAPGAATSSW